jgi:hypothetical protein
MDIIEFQCKVTTSDTNKSNTPLAVEFMLNGKTVYPLTAITEPTSVSFDIPNKDGAEYELDILVSGKTLEHTTVDQDNNIVNDVTLSLTEFKIDDIDIDSIILTNPLPYHHNYNGHSNDFIDQFFDVAGCNGTIKFKFTTPFYLWLLENM